MTYHNAMGVDLEIGAAQVQSYSIVSGVAKPSTFAELDLFKELQRQVNRVGKAKGFAAIGIDGDIGPGTIAAVQKAQAAAKADLTAGKLTDTRAATGVALIRSSTADGIASGVPTITGYIKGYADQLGVSSSVSSPKPPQPPAIYNASTGATTAQPATASAFDAFKNMDSTSQMASIGLLGVAGYLLLTKKKRRK